MHDCVLPFDKSDQMVAVLDIAELDPEFAPDFGIDVREIPQAGEGVVVNEAGDTRALRDQPLGQMATDETAGARQQNLQTLDRGWRRRLGFDRMGQFTGRGSPAFGQSRSRAAGSKVGAC